MSTAQQLAGPEEFSGPVFFLQHKVPRFASAAIRIPRT